MLINELPDDCLLTIFDCIQDLEDLVNCFKVCKKWYNFIVVRTKKVKYLIRRPNYSPDSVCHQTYKQVDVPFLIKWLPNLRIIEFDYTGYGVLPTQDIAKLLRGLESLKGIIFFFLSLWVRPADLKRLNLEMMSTSEIIPDLNENMRQLYFSGRNIDLCKEVAHPFPNLERLNIRKADNTEYYFNGPLMANLKILELDFNSRDESSICLSFKLMDLCPALQSAHIRICGPVITIDDSMKHANLQDLVMDFHHSIEWDDLRRLMSKYPNLKHLAIRNGNFKDDYVKQLILILPKLTLLDVRESSWVTQEAADYVQDYCKRYGRSIKFYFKRDDKQIEADWPQILNRPEKICRGFDFMEHCFFKSFYQLPHFLDPIDD